MGPEVNKNVGRSEANSKNKLEKAASTQKRSSDPLNKPSLMIFDGHKEKTSDGHLDAERTGIVVSDQTTGVVSCFTGLY